MRESKKWVVVMHFETADDYPPYTWDWNELVGERVTNVHVWNATDEDNLPNRLRITADDVEEV